MGEVKHSVVLTTAVAGSGKTYARCACYLADDFLPRETGAVWCNYPIKIEEMVKYVCSRHGRLRPDAVERRIRLIPHEVLVAWRAGESGPWEYFGTRPVDVSRLPFWAGSDWPEAVQGEAVDITHDLIALDEAHKFIGAFTHQNDKKSEKSRRLQAWQNFIGEIRHRGARIEFVTQSPRKLHPIVANEAGARISLTNAENLRDFLFNIPMSDWYELLGLLTGAYCSKVYQREYVDKDGKEALNRECAWRMDPEHFALYESYSTPEEGQASAAGKLSHQYEKGWVRTLWWFTWRNLEPLATRFAMAAALIWACFFGGISWASGKLVNKIVDISKGLTAQTTQTAMAMPGPKKQVDVKDLVSPGRNLSAIARGKLPEVPYETNGRLIPVSRYQDRKTTETKSQEKNEGAVEAHIQMLTRRWIMLDNRQKIMVGETVNGEKLESISTDTLRCMVAGRELRLGSVLRLAGEAAGTTESLGPAGNRGKLPGAPGGGRAQGR